MKKNLVLCGFMGSGKSTIGRQLSEKLGMRFIDTDTYIEQKEGMTISQIFEEKGEEYFRELELETCRELSKLRGSIISTGGGTLLRDCNVTRPLLRREDKEKAVKNLLSQRIPLYNRAADYVIDAEEAPRKVCLQIMNIYNSIS